MASRRKRVLVVVLLVVVAVLLALGSTNGNRVTGTFGERTISVESAHALSSATLAFQESQVVVTLGDVTATITADAVLLPDGRMVPLPPARRSIELEADGRDIRVTVDGVLQAGG